MISDCRFVSFKEVENKDSKVDSLKVEQPIIEAFLFKE